MSLTLPCEFSVKEILPALRSIIAEKLVTEKGMSIYKAANTMGITPAAVANYVNKRRGTGIRSLIEKDERLMGLVNDLVDRMVNSKVENLSTYYCILCSEGKRVLKKTGMEVPPCMYENYVMVK